MPRWKPLMIGFALVAGTLVVSLCIVPFARHSEWNSRTPDGFIDQAIATDATKGNRSCCLGLCIRLGRDRIL